MKSTPRFDYDFNGDEYCAVGGEMASGNVMDGLCDCRPDGALNDIGAAHPITKLGQLDCNEFHTARMGTQEKDRHGSSGLMDEQHTAREGTRDR